MWQTDIGNYGSFFVLLPSLPYGSWDTEWDKFLSFWTIFCLFTPLITRKSKFGRKEKTIWRCHRFTHVYQESRSYEVCFLRYGVWHIFSVILAHLLPFYPTIDHNYWNLEKMQKKAWWYYPFTHVHYKWRSYDAWFLRYKTPHTEFFVILDYFLLFCLPNNTET